MSQGSAGRAAARGRGSASGRLEREPGRRAEEARDREARKEPPVEGPAASPPRAPRRTSGADG